MRMRPSVPGCSKRAGDGGRAESMVAGLTGEVAAPLRDITNVPLPRPPSPPRFSGEGRSCSCGSSSSSRSTPSGAAVAAVPAACRQRRQHGQGQSQGQGHALPFELIAAIVASAGPPDDPGVHLLPYERMEALRTMLARQQAALPNPTRPAAHLALSELRTRFVNWIMTCWALRTETVFLTASIIDRYIAHSDAGSCQGRRFGLAGIAALSLATGFEENVAAPMTDLLAAMDHAYTQQELASMAAAMLASLGSQVSSPSAAHILPAFLEAMGAWTTSSLVSRVCPKVAKFAEVLPSSSQVSKRSAQESAAREDLAWWFLRLALFNARTVPFMPSKVAASAVLLSNRIYDCRPEWPLAMERLSGHSRSDLGDCVLLLERHWRSRRC